MKIVFHTTDQKSIMLTIKITIISLIIGFSNCGKTYLVIYFLLQKQELFNLITKSIKKYPNIEAQISDEIQPLDRYENNTVYFDGVLLPIQASNFDLF